MNPETLCGLAMVVNLAVLSLLVAITWRDYTNGRRAISLRISEAIASEEARQDRLPKGTLEDDRLRELSAAYIAGLAAAARISRGGA